MKFRNREATVNFKRYEDTENKGFIEIPDNVLPQKDGKPDMDYIKDKMKLRPITDSKTAPVVPKDKVKGTDGE